ncbi:hypothetical protein ACLOJK_020940 [Asimina triloba]
MLSRPAVAWVSVSQHLRGMSSTVDAEPEIVHCTALVNCNGLCRSFSRARVDGSKMCTPHAYCRGATLLYSRVHGTLSFHVPAIDLDRSSVESKGIWWAISRIPRLEINAGDDSVGKCKELIAYDSKCWLSVAIIASILSLLGKRVSLAPLPISRFPKDRSGMVFQNFNRTKVAAGCGPPLSGSIPMPRVLPVLLLYLAIRIAKIEEDFLNFES